MSTTNGGHAWRGYAVLSLAWLVVIGGVLLFMRRPTGDPIEILPPPTLPPTATQVPSPTPGPLHVDVAGAVQTPGVYKLPPDSIVADALKAAICSQEPDHQSSTQLVEALQEARDIRSDILDTLWCNGLRTVLKSVNRHSTLQPGVKKYIKFVSPFIV